MYSTCLHCTRDLGTNDIVETLPIGRRIAFDAAQGSLWVVCRSCAKWNLVPFDTRLESIDTCERMFSDTKTRFSTDNIGLARMADGLDLVRIGAPQRPEFASWRYGSQYKRRRRQTLALAGAGGAVAFGALMSVEALGLVSSTIISAFSWQALQSGWNGIRAYRRQMVANVPGGLRPMKFREVEFQSAHIDVSGSDLRLRFRRPSTVPGDEHAIEVVGADARHLARRMTGALNDVVGSAVHLRAALRHLESGAMRAWLQEKSSRALVGKPRTIFTYEPFERWEGYGPNTLRIAALPAGERLGLEMWLSEEDEARALSGELALLERQWKEAEQIAKIADSLAIPEDQPS